MYWTSSDDVKMPNNVMYTLFKKKPSRRILDEKVLTTMSKKKKTDLVTKRQAEETKANSQYEVYQRYISCDMVQSGIEFCLCLDFCTIRRILEQCPSNFSPAVWSDLLNSQNEEHPLNFATPAQFLAFGSRSIDAAYHACDSEALSALSATRTTLNSERLNTYNNCYLFELLSLFVQGVRRLAEKQRMLRISL